MKERCQVLSVISGSKCAKAQGHKSVQHETADGRAFYNGKQETDYDLASQNERLWTENRRLRRALELIASHNPQGCRALHEKITCAYSLCLEELQAKARAALDTPEDPG